MSELSEKALEAAEELKTTDPYDKTEGRIEKTLRECAEALDAKQAQIDALILEYCPDEMTEEQIEEWRKHQRPVI